jgi:hypothetical protein
MKSLKSVSRLGVLAVGFGAALSVAAQEPGEADLAKASQNPVANIISIPLEYWINEADAGDADVLLAKPVIPTGLGSKYNLINRFIVPYAWVDGGVDPALPVDIEPPNVDVSGLGDLTYQGFISPAKPGRIIWGLGAAVTFPTASEDLLGTNRYSAGPSVLVLTMPGKWVLGLLAQNVWDFAGSGDASVNQLTLQPIVNYNIKNGWYVFSVPVWTANSEADEEWTIPLGGGVGKLHRIGKLPVDFKIGYYDNVEKPEKAPDGSWLFSVKFLIPTG